MNHSPSLLFGLALPLVALISFCSSEVSGQTLPGLRQGRLQDAFNVQGARIDEQRVNRQTEVARLERIIDAFESRVTRLERQLLVASRMPAITVAEAEAAVQFAAAQLRESEQLHKQGEASDVRLAGDRLAVARAQGQIDAVTAAHADNLISLELDVLYAEYNLFEQNREKSQLERIAAKGYMPSSGLKTILLGVGLAEKQLQLARLRLETQRRFVASDKPAAEKE
jgi:hypothetical protein